MPNISLPGLARYQHDAFFCAERNSAIEASTKSGKTFTAIVWLLSRAFAVPGVHRWIAPVYPQSEIAFRRMCDMLRQMDPHQLVWSSTRVPMTIICKSGARIEFRSGDDPDNLYGEDAQSVVIDEASRCEEGVWAAVQSTVTATGGPIRAIGNVKGRGNWFYRLCRKIQADQLPNWRYSAFDYRMAVKAKVINQSAVDEARQTLPETAFKELYENVASDDGGNPFGLQHIAARVTAMSDAEPVVFGVDIARAVDYTVVTGLDASGRVCRFHRWNQVPWSETTDRIIQLTGEVPTLIDSTGVGDAVVEGIQRRRGAVEGFQFTSTSKQQLMQALAVGIQSGTIGFPDGPIRHELDAFEFDVRANGVRYSAPDGFHDDCVMSLALAHWKRISSRPVSVDVVAAVAPAKRDDWGSSGGGRTGYGFAGSRGRGYGGW